MQCQMCDFTTLNSLLFEIILFLTKFFQEFFTGFYHFWLHVGSSFSWELQRLRVTENSENSAPVSRFIWPSILYHATLYATIVFIFEKAILPSFQYLSILITGSDEGYICVLPFLKKFFSVVWAIPVCIITKIYSFPAFLVFFKQTYDYIQTVRPSHPIWRKPLTQYHILVDNCLTIMTQCLYMLISYALVAIFDNVCMKIVFTFNMALLYSLYAFEYVWMKKNMTFEERYSRIHACYPYYFGFGISFVILTNFSTPLINSLIFVALFPAVITAAILSSNHHPRTFSKRINVFTPSVVCCNFVLLFILKTFNARLLERKKSISKKQPPVIHSSEDEKKFEAMEKEILAVPRVHRVEEENKLPSITATSVQTAESIINNEKKPSECEVEPSEYIILDEDLNEMIASI